MNKKDEMYYDLARYEMIETEIEKNRQRYRILIQHLKDVISNDFKVFLGKIEDPHIY